MKVECGTLTARDSLGKSEVLSGQKEPPPIATYAAHGLARDRTSDSVVSSHCTACRLLLSSSAAQTLWQQSPVRIEQNAIWTSVLVWPYGTSEYMHVGVTSCV